MAYRRKFWRNMMRSALTYEEWVHATRMLDKETPKMNESDLYDEEVVRNKLQELHHRREEGSLRDIMFCMRADLARISDSWHSLQFFDQMGGIFTVVKRVMTREAVHEIRQLQMMLRHLTSNPTFQEAYDMTVTASRAIPGLFEAQELIAKDRSGEIVPYHPPFILGPDEGLMPVRRWRDGSLEIDLRIMQLKELFNINHFIVSQANPHIAPLLRLKEFVIACGGNFAAKAARMSTGRGRCSTSYGSISLGRTWAWRGSCCWKLERVY
ncbi:hypothetical protein ACFX11_041062 [Malus domestica]|uniref:Triacylglycerol lipase N-terminal domain-containing protein n=1 Tax=Malus domestica TaxID=3750 RepID=A0A498JHH9_MALDO|nr:hypothetical protein DVH24_011905 [Malus domestica]